MRKVYFIHPKIFALFSHVLIIADWHTKTSEAKVNYAWNKAALKNCVGLHN